MAPNGKGPLRSVAAPVFPLAAKTLREQIAAGDFFGKDGIEVGICTACRSSQTDIDTRTGLDRACWRIHRWSNGGEYVLKGM